MENYNTKVKLFLDSIDLKHANIGYRYLTTAIELGLGSAQRIKICELYEETARIHGTTMNNVARSIRYSIQPIGLTNKEFIMRAIDKISSQTSADLIYRGASTVMVGDLRQQCK